VRAPKLYATDSGLLAYLGGIDSWSDAVELGRAGPLLETWAVGEVRALDRLSPRPSTLCYWRIADGREVDMVLERGARVVAIEIKASASLGHADTLALRGMRDALGRRFRLGIVAHLGDSAVALDRSLAAVPLASLLGAA
jgi:predicted AAA+ superfamily ATPase